MKQWPSKDPDEVLDYDVKWDRRLAGDAISASQWFKVFGDDALVVDMDTFTSQRTKVWFSGGTPSGTYEYTNRVHTIGGRTMDQTVTLQVVASK